jgi:hypothetical protein
MRGILLSSIIVLGLSFAGTSSFATSAAPVNTALTRAAANASLLEPAYYDRWGRWCSRRCNWRRCWTICR